MTRGADQLHRIVVESWPTPDGKPFDQTDPAFLEAWEDWHNAGGTADAEPLPRQIPSNVPLDDYQMDDGRIWWPKFTRRVYQSRSAAQRRAATMRRWGIVCFTEHSEPIKWSTN